MMRVMTGTSLDLNQESIRNKSSQETKERFDLYWKKKLMIGYFGMFIKSPLIVYLNKTKT